MTARIQSKENIFMVIRNNRNKIKKFGVRKLGLFESIIRKEEFQKDETLKRTYVRSMEIIGEASKKSPADLKEKYAHLEWRAMTGMRDTLIHDYF
jgi:uncharacterized protein with HEPN domain